jgi:hypothetical protein
MYIKSVNPPKILIVFTFHVIGSAHNPHQIENKKRAIKKTKISIVTKIDSIDLLAEVLLDLDFALLVIEIPAFLWRFP